MKTTDWSAVTASAPINKEAAVARDGSGDQFNSIKRICQIHSRECLPTIPCPKNKKNLTGKKRDRLTVIGLYAGEDNPKAVESKGSLWVCKCVCGAYVTRRQHKLAKDTTTIDACDECRQLEYLKHVERRKAYGDRRAEEIQNREREARRAGK